ncbi:hypothetical protein [Chitinophaga sp. MM2321]|uniref:hypothetical protein n=1 Tax=Chitinophaga sp. MM2321 TaxID=3137178 RepID=UPI0032D59EEC
MTTISHEKLIEFGFSYQEAKKSYRIETGTSSFGIVHNGNGWLCSPLPMEHVSLMNVATMEELKEIVYK